MCSKRNLHSYKPICSVTTVLPHLSAKLDSCGGTHTHRERETRTPKSNHTDKPQQLNTVEVSTEWQHYHSKEEKNHLQRCRSSALGTVGQLLYYRNQPV